MDDEEIIRLYIEQILLEEGIETFLAASGKEAVKMLQEKNFDLILTDLAMQEVNGLQVLEEVKRISPETVVIIVTGNASFRTVVQAMQKGAYDYILKPLTKDELLIRVNRGIEKYHLERRLNEIKRIETLTSNIGIFTLDHEGFFLHGNSNLSKRLWDVSTLNGKSIYDLPSIKKSGILKGFKQSLNGKSYDSDLVRIFKKSTNQEFILSIHFRPITGENGDLKFITLIIGEVSQRIKVIEKISQAERLAAVGKLAAGVAHEINNPLNIISLDVEFMKSRISPDDPAIENINSIGEEVDRIAHIVQQLQDHIRPSKGMGEFIDLNHLFHDHIFSVTFDQLSKKQVAVKLDLLDNLPMVQISKTKLTQVLMNFIKNAEDAMDAKGELTISTNQVLLNGLQKHKQPRLQSLSQKRKPGNFVEIKIVDTGTGIPQEHLNSLFDPFFTTKGSKGNGLGLFICYSIIKSYNGSISVSSTPGLGTEFSILLPIVSTDCSSQPINTEHLMLRNNESLFGTD